MTTAPDRPFSPFLFRLYASDLSEAIYDLSRETMGATSNLRQQLGIDNVRVRFGDNRQFITMTNPDGSETTVELDVTASTDEIARALNIAGPKMTPPLPTNDIVPLAVRSVAPIKKNLTGASFLADLIRTQQAAIKQQLAQAGTDMTSAMTELQGIANEATNQVKAVQAETADLRAALGLNSNSGPA